MRLSAMLRIDFAHDVPGGSPMMLDCWGCLNGWTYVRLRPGTDPKAIEAQFPAWKKRNIPDENEGGMRHNAGDHQNWHLVRVDDVHLGEAQGAAMAAGNDRTTIAAFAVIAMLILGMAVVNFTNLATARGSQRAREIALRKLLGASRGRLVAQFIAESLLVASLAMLIALALAELLVRPFSAFLDADLHLTYLGRGGVALPALILIAMVGVLGGLYPAFFLSRFKPALVLRANQSAETPGSGRLRAVLVLAQFAVSIGLIACTAIIYAQSAFARSADPGFRRDHILQIQQLSRRQLIDKGAAIEEQMRHVPGVDAVGLTDIGVATDNSSDAGVWFPGNPRSTSIGNYFVDRGFFDALGMKLLAGRWFDDRRPMDDMTLPAAASDPAAEKALVARGANIVVNMEAVRKLGFARAADIVGKPLRIQFGSSGPDAGLLPVTVIGVVGDVRLRSIKRPLEPILFQKADTGESFMVVRFHGDPAALKARVEGVWKSFTNEVPFDAQFSEDIMLDLYRAEDAQAKSFAAFAFLSVTIACLGLFGLAAFLVERRTKEIGIRKVLGARVRDIVRLLVWQFSKPVIVANLIAWPVAWWVMRGWLNGFDSRIALGPAPFLLAGGLALLIAVVTVAGHALRVARLNPIHALRYE
jgi:putative ABC transport system permease protein